MASHSHGHEVEIVNPGPYAAPGAMNILFLVFTIIGVISFAAGLMTDSGRAWASFLQNHFYFVSLALGGLFFAAIQWLTGAMWSAPIRRVSESFTAYLPVALVLFVVLCFGMSHLYLWTHAERVAGDIILEGKTGYLNVPFFVIRNIVVMGIFLFFAWKMVGNSVRQDATRSISHTLANRFLAPPFMIMFAIGFSIMSFDLMMSLNPHWFSTMFAVYCFAGLFYSVLALTCLISLYLKGTGQLEGIVNDNHLHDLGKFMLAFTIFYAYIGFCQYMLIWYANLPEETFYFMKRMQGGWFYVTAFLLFGKFMVPFFLLLPRGSKRNEKLLFVVAIFMLVAHWIDVMWIVQPEFFPEGPSVGFIELGTAIGFIGLFGLSVVRFLSRNNVVAIGDPHLAEAVNHHHQ